MPPFDSEFLRAAILIASPLILVALGELISEIAGVFNIGLEGMMLVGAFAGFWAGGELGNLWLGVLVGVGAGVLLAVIMAFASIQAGADQIVVGGGAQHPRRGPVRLRLPEVLRDPARPVSSTAWRGWRSPA